MSRFRLVFRFCVSGLSSVFCVQLTTLVFAVFPRFVSLQYPLKTPPLALIPTHTYIYTRLSTHESIESPCVVHRRDDWVDGRNEIKVRRQTTEGKGDHGRIAQMGFRVEGTLPPHCAPHCALSHSLTFCSTHARSHGLLVGGARQFKTGPCERKRSVKSCQANPGKNNVRSS
jgi:hypothetical protein